MLAGMSTDQVVDLYPAAPPVSDSDLQAASDWAEGEIERDGLTLPAVNSRQERELKRAIAAYALYLGAGGAAAASRLTSTAGAGAVKSISLGTLKLERTAVNTEAVAAGMATSAGEWLEIAGRHLAGAGLVGGWAFPGASR